MVASALRQRGSLRSSLIRRIPRQTTCPVRQARPSRLGLMAQFVFRSAYSRRAAHIIPYGAGGKHEIPNGLLLRADIHKLFDRGYVTVTPKYRFRVSPLPR